MRYWGEGGRGGEGTYDVMISNADKLVACTNQWKWESMNHCAKTNTPADSCFVLIGLR